MASVPGSRGASRGDLYSEITNRIIADLEAGVVPWVQPWAASAAPLGMPRNAATGRPYSGINVLLLWTAVIDGGFSSQRWLTFRQALALGGHVRKGERGTLVVFADRFTPEREKRRAEAEGGEPARVPFLKRFVVFNVDQCEGLPERLVPPAPPPDASLILPRAQALIAGTQARFRIGGSYAFYSPIDDLVVVPPPQAFFDAIDWHRTAFHELGHWTGHTSRLDRDQSGLFGTPSYAREELVAEMAGAFVCASLEIAPTVRHADYLGSWLEVLREDSRAIVAQRARRPERRTICWRSRLARRAILRPRPDQRKRRVRALRWDETGERGSPGPSRRRTMKKIILSPARDIAFDQLELSQANVRRVKAGCSIEQLAEDIARRGLIQSLSVRPILDVEGAETGRFEVPAGGRRFRALELLVKAKRLAKSAPVPCVVRAADAPTSATEDSLAENVQREALHPLDQFRAFRTLREEGQSVEDIAARFFVAPAVVHQRLKLVAVSPKLLDLYAEDQLTLEQLMAFSVSNDHARQEAVWDVIGAGWSKEPWQIRRMLTEGAVQASDRRARFVGVGAYEAAGGVVLRDLFDEDQGGWLQDTGLLEQLALEKLRSEAEAIVAEGWKWVDAAPEFPYGHHFGMRLIAATPAALTEVDEAEWEALRAEQAQLEETWEQAEELPDEVDARLGEIEEALAGFESRPAVYDPDEVTRAGAFVCISSAGTLVVERGFVRPEDEPQAQPDPDAAPGEEGETPPLADPGTDGEAVETAESPEEEELRPLPDRLLGELSAARTLALREALGRTRVIAFQAVLHAFCLSIFYNRTGTGCVEIAIRRPGLAVQGPGLAESAAAQAIDARHAAWVEQLPDDAAALWEWIRQLGLVEALELFAHCAAQSLNALIEPVSRYGDGHVSAAVLERRLREADLFADAVSLDMADAGWVATVDSYFGKVTKPRILEAVREAKGDIAAGRITGLRKPDMAVEAEQVVAGTGWLPEVLRSRGYRLAGPPESVVEPEPEALLAAE